MSVNPSEEVASTNNRQWEGEKDTSQPAHNHLGSTPTSTGLRAPSEEGPLWAGVCFSIFFCFVHFSVGRRLQQKRIESEGKGDADWEALGGVPARGLYASASGVSGPEKQ